jgi:hypothetical protein
MAFGPVQRILPIAMVLGLALHAGPWSSLAAEPDGDDRSVANRWVRHAARVPDDRAGVPEDGSTQLEVEWAQRFVNPYVPNLIDVPSTDLVDRYHPTFELRIIQTWLGPGSFTNIRSARRTGVRLDYHYRLSRDFQATVSAPFYKERLDLISGPVPDMPGAISALEFEIKYLVPYEVAGFRTALGGRVGSSKERSHPLFTPDDYFFISGLYATVSKTPAPTIRVSGTAAYVNIPQPDGLIANAYWMFAGAFENQFFTLRDNWVRWIVEVNTQWFDRRAYNTYGDRTRLNEYFLNTGLRFRTGILHLDLGLRHVAQSGYGEAYFAVTKRF